MFDQPCAPISVNLPTSSHELLVAVALGIPTRAGILVDLDLAGVEAEIVDSVAPCLLLLPIEALVGETVPVLRNHQGELLFMPYCLLI